MDDSPSELNRLAITAALSANWEEALKLNQQLIDINPDHLDAIIRIARAYFELGNLGLSKKNYEKVLKIDPYNQIAAKFLKRIKAFSKKSVLKNSPSHPQRAVQYITDLFIEEPGKTKLVSLLKVAEPQRLSLLYPGTPLLLVPKKRGVVVTDLDNQYLGILPDDLANHLLRLMKGGNKYQVLIKAIKTNGVSIIIREIYRSARFKNQPSFLDSLNTNFTYSSDNIMANEANEKETEEIYEEETS